MSRWTTSAGEIGSHQLALLAGPIGSLGELEGDNIESNTGLLNTETEIVHRRSDFLDARKEGDKLIRSIFHGNANRHEVLVSLVNDPNTKKHILIKVPANEIGSIAGFKLSHTIDPPAVATNKKKARKSKVPTRSYTIQDDEMDLITERMKVINPAAAALFIRMIKDDKNKPREAIPNTNETSQNARNLRFDDPVGLKAWKSQQGALLDEPIVGNNHEANKYRLVLSYLLAASKENPPTWRSGAEEIIKACKNKTRAERFKATSALIGYLPKSRLYTVFNGWTKCHLDADAIELNSNLSQGLKLLPNIHMPGSGLYKLTNGLKSIKNLPGIPRGGGRPSNNIITKAEMFAQGQILNIMAMANSKTRYAMAKHTCRNAAYTANRMAMFYAAGYALGSLRKNRQERENVFRLLCRKAGGTDNSFAKFGTHTHAYDEDKITLQYTLYGSSSSDGIIRLFQSWNHSQSSTYHHPLGNETSKTNSLASNSGSNDFAAVFLGRQEIFELFFEYQLQLRVQHVKDIQAEIDADPGIVAKTILKDCLDFAVIYPSKARLKRAPHFKTNLKKLKKKNNNKKRFVVPHDWTKEVIEYTVKSQNYYYTPDRSIRCTGANAVERYVKNGFDKNDKAMVKTIDIRRR